MKPKPIWKDGVPRCDEERPCLELRRKSYAPQLRDWICLVTSEEPCDCLICLPAVCDTNERLLAIVDVVKKLDSRFGHFRTMQSFGGDTPAGAIGEIASIIHKAADIDLDT